MRYDYITESGKTITQDTGGKSLTQAETKAWLSGDIHTHYWAKPIPVRDFDWDAVTENYEPGDPIGYGNTEKEAVADLCEQLEPDDEQLRYETETGVKT